MEKKKKKKKRGEQWGWREQAAREEGRVDMKRRRGSEGKEEGEKTDLIADWR